ncbi:MAG: hypothetical protein CW338_09965, partial [Clostridiales bacterium]|nr:hypothetical protein [Clostridiales bacterium]
VEEGANIEGIYSAADVNEDALLVNGWTVMSEDEGTAMMDDDMKALFASAFPEGFAGASYTAEEVIASKAMDDGSVLYLFKGTQTLVIAEPVTRDGFTIISVMTDAEGNRTAEFRDFFAVEDAPET